MKRPGNPKTRAKAENDKKVFCYVCGDKGRVPIGFKDWDVGMREAMKFVDCHKCHGQRQSKIGLPWA